MRKKFVIQILIKHAIIESLMNNNNSNERWNASAWIYLIVVDRI